MKPKNYAWISWSFIFLLANGRPVTGQPPSTPVDITPEARSAWAKAELLADQGRYTAAVELVDGFVDEDVVLHATTSDELVENLTQLANWHFYSRQVESALRRAQQTDRLIQDRNKIDSMAAIDSRWFVDWLGRLNAVSAADTLALVEGQKQLDAARAAEDSTEMVRISEQFLGLERKVLGNDHPYLANSLFEIGSELFELGQYEQAIVSLAESMSIRQKVLGLNHVGTIENAFLLGVYLREVERNEESLKWLEFAKNHSLRLNDKEIAANCERQIAITHTWLDEWGKANKALHMEMRLRRELADFDGEVQCLRDLIGIYSNLSSQSSSGSKTHGLANIAIMRIDFERAQQLIEDGNVKTGMQLLEKVIDKCDDLYLCADSLHAEAVLALQSTMPDTNASEVTSLERTTRLRAAAIYAAVDNAGGCWHTLKTLSMRFRQAGDDADAVKTLQLAAQQLKLVQPKAEQTIEYSRIVSIDQTANDLLVLGSVDDAIDLFLWGYDQAEDTPPLSPLRVGMAESLAEIYSQRELIERSDYWLIKLQTELDVCESLLDVALDRTVPLPLNEKDFYPTSDACLRVTLRNNCKAIDIKERLRWSKEIDAKFKKLDQMLHVMRSDWSILPRINREIRPLLWKRLINEGEHDVVLTGSKPEWYLEALQNYEDCRTPSWGFDIAEEYHSACKEQLRQFFEQGESSAEIAEKVLELSDQLKNTLPLVAAQPEMRVLVPCVEAISHAQLGRLARSIDLLASASRELERQVIYGGGDVKDRISWSSNIRRDLDPFELGCMMAAAADDFDAAVGFAIAGRCLGTRNALKALAKDPIEAFADDKDADAPVERIVGLSMEQRGLLGPKERMLIVCAFATAGTEAPLRAFLVRPTTNARKNVAYHVPSSWLMERNLTGGVLVTDVLPGGSASLGGIRPLDVITKYGGKTVNWKTISEQVAEHKNQEDVTVGLIRDGDEVTLEIEQGEQLGISFQKADPPQAWRQLSIAQPALLSLTHDQILRQHSRGSSRVRGALDLNALNPPSQPDWISKVDLPHPSLRMHRSLFSPEVWKELKECDRVYVSLPSELSGLPLETLVVEPAGPGQSDATRWIDVGPPIVYLPTGRLDRAKRQGAPDTPKAELDRMSDFKLVAAGDVDFTSFPGFDALLGTRREVQAAAQHVGLDRSLVLTGDDANERSLRNSVSSAEFVLISSHGDIRGGDKVLESAVLLTPGEGEQATSDGRLTLRELLSDWRGTMEDTKVTILSACQSNRGLVLHDENSLGLPFGFLAAGSEAVIASQWPVDDDATAVLFGEFFRRIEAGEPTLEAFTAARQHLRLIPQYADPYYWAPFIYVAD